MSLHAIGFGSLNLDEFWEVDREFLSAHKLEPGEEYVRDIDWFGRVYPELGRKGVRKAVDPGGSAANMIAALARMGFETGFFGVTGKQDADALRLHELGKAENLRIKTIDVPAGRCLALVDRKDPVKDRVLVVLPNANDMAGSEDPDLNYFQQAQWLHLTSFVSLTCLESQIGLVRRLSGTTKVSFDPGALYSQMGIEAVRPILDRTECLFVTEGELKSLTVESSKDTGIAKLLAIGVPLIVLKFGSDGMSAFTCDREFHQLAVAPSRVLDTTGAGDVTAAGFFAGMIASLGIEGSLMLAASAASRSIEGYGRASYPDRAFVEREIWHIRDLLGLE